MPIARGLRLGIVTAFPPGQNSLNEFGYHLVRHLVTKPEVDQLVMLTDRTDAGPPLAMPGAIADPCWTFNDWRNVSNIVRTARKHDLDAVLINLQFATFGDRRIAGGLGLLTPAALRRAGIPTGVILHNLADNVDFSDAGFASSRRGAWLMAKAGRIMTRAILRANYVALTIPKYVEFLQSSYGATNVLLTPHGSLEDIPEPAVGRPAGPRKILAFGKWGTYKRVELLVDAFEELLTRGFDDIELIIAGPDSPNSPGYLAGVEAAYRHVPGLSFRGYIPEEDVAPLFRGATVVAFPYTSTTGSSGVLHQAGAFGRAAVLPSIGDFAEVIEEEGFVGTYFEPDDVISLADALAKVIDDDTLIADHGTRNYLAATGIPIGEVVDWHLIHLRAAQAGSLSTTPLQVGT